jgi:hypothetical protein
MLCRGKSNPLLQESCKNTICVYKTEFNALSGWDTLNTFKQLKYELCYINVHSVYENINLE